MTRTITGQVFRPDGTPWSGGVVKFELRTSFSTSTTVYPKYVHSETLDVNGEFNIDLAVPDTGAVLYKIILPDNLAYEVYLEAGAPTNLQTLITIATTASSPNDLQVLLDANNVLTITNVDDTYTVLSTDEYLRCNGTFEVTLPASTGSGDVYFIANIGTGTITPVVTGSDTINGTTPLVIPANTIAYYVDAEAGNWHSNW